jgi:hypothetical protein
LRVGRPDGHRSCLLGWTGDQAVAVGSIELRLRAAASPVIDLAAAPMSHTAMQPECPALSQSSREGRGFSRNSGAMVFMRARMHAGGTRGNPAVR